MSAYEIYVDMHLYVLLIYMSDTYMSKVLREHRSQLLEALGDVVADACRPDNDDVTRRSSFLPVYQLLLYWNHSNIQDQVSVNGFECVQGVLLSSPVS